MKTIEEMKADILYRIEGIEAELVKVKAQAEAATSRGPRKGTHDFLVGKTEGLTMGLGELRKILRNLGA